MAQSWKTGLRIFQIALRGAGEYKCARPAAKSFNPSSLSLSTSAPSSASKSFFATSAKMASQTSFLQALEERRTYYQLNKESPISDKQITDIAEKAILYVPSAFNSQSTRFVVLLNNEHEKFWDAVAEVLKPLTPEDQYPKTQQKLAGFKAGYGTVLFYEDPTPVDKLKQAYPIYAQQFGDWSEHTNAMHQYAMWVALQTEGFGANLQHYSPVIDPRAAQEWNIPLEWKLRAQLVFGGRSGEPGKKQYKPVQGERLFVHGAKQ